MEQVKKRPLFNPDGDVSVNARRIIGGNKSFPPMHLFLGNVAELTTQKHKVVSGPILRMRNQRIRVFPRPTLETHLKHPNDFHIDNETVLDQ